MCVDALAADVTRVPLKNILHSILTFKGGFEELTLAYKYLIFIDDSPVDLGQISLEVHKYKSDSEVTLPPYNEITASFLPKTPPSSARACAVFVDVATKNKAMYKQTTREKKANIQNYRA